MPASPPDSTYYLSVLPPDEPPINSPYESEQAALDTIRRAVPQAVVTAWIPFEYDKLPGAHRARHVFRSIQDYWECEMEGADTRDRLIAMLIHTMPPLDVAAEN